jgi:hypothetical protein
MVPNCAHTLRRGGPDGLLSSFGNQFRPLSGRAFCPIPVAHERTFPRQTGENLKFMFASGHTQITLPLLFSLSHSGPPSNSPQIPPRGNLLMRESSIAAKAQPFPPRKHCTPRGIAPNSFNPSRATWAHEFK